MLDDRILVKPLEGDEKSSGGVVLPDVVHANEKRYGESARGVVREVGPGRLRGNGARFRPDVKPGDVVLYSTMGHVKEQRPVTLDGEELVTLTEEHLLGVLEESP